MPKKDYLFALIVGFITALFFRLILLNTATQLAYGGIRLPLWSLFIILPAAQYTAYLIALRFFQRFATLRELGRFGIVGLMNFSVDTGIVSELRTRTGISIEDPRIIWLLLVGTSIAILNSYFWQRTWTFREKAPPSRKEFMLFVFVTLVGIGINIGFAYITILSLSPLGLFTEPRLLVVSKVAATAISLFWNFFGYKFFVFA